MEFKIGKLKINTFGLIAIILTILLIAFGLIHGGDTTKVSSVTLPIIYIQGISN